MSAVELTGLYENLSLAEEDGAALEASEEVQQEGAVDVDRSLVGRVLSGKRERNRFWQRSPWHFGKSLIVLEKPVGSRDVSKLGFNRAEFWVQIHDIPIMCMNRRMARWLAEQICVVVEIPSDSRECWGKFIRVKVQIDISKLLKRWLRLKLGKEDDIVVIRLKYERLSDFCFACGQIGHMVKECLDEEAKKGALDGSSMSAALIVREVTAEDGDLRDRLGSLPTVPRFDEPNSKEVESNSMLIEKLSPNYDNQKMKKPIPQATPTKKSGRKWKRAARGGEQLQLVGKSYEPSATHADGR
ncbi:hypothetical protein EZV62_004990 [Acer yangbiense]|uniref:CCHC-type domain-containing protein n=1 Tax=Acer yangbiense TaxID=1000413 RepID=A0A5C7ILJ3_9ROSI|nr:hypothetical protein EZV62_004990 [Acer yangbiense]